MIYFNKNPKPRRKLDRRHYTYNGKPKVSYDTLADAKQILKNYSEQYTAYLCPICNKCHIGLKKNSPITWITPSYRAFLLFIN